MADYKTHTGLKLSWTSTEDGHLVVLAGDREKILYKGDSQAEASSAYMAVKAHYEQRKKDEK